MKTTHMKIILNTFFLITLFIMSTNCGSGTTIVGNTSTNPTASEITLSKLSSGSVTATIPLAAFGSSDEDVETTALSITNNGVELSGDFDLPSHYNSTTQRVTLAVTGLEADDILTFEFTLDDNSRLSYSGHVSSTTSSTASLTGSADGSITISDSGRYISGTFSSSLAGAYVPTTGSCFRSDSSDYEAFFVAADGAVTNIDFLEDQMESHASFSDATATSFSAIILETGYSITCDFAMATTGISGDCEVTEVTSSTYSSLLGETCTIDYAKCTSVTQSDYYDSASDLFDWDSSLSSNLETCYNDN